MRTYTTITETTLRRKAREQTLTILDRGIPAFGLRIAPDGTRTFFVRVARKLGTAKITLGTAVDMTATEARAKALAEIEDAAIERATGPLMADFAEEFTRRLARRWKPATRDSNRHLVRNHVLPFFGEMRVADITRAHVRRWFDSMSERPGTANRTLPVLSVMMKQAELWDLRPQGSNPCRNMRRYRRPPMERFLSADELKRLGFVLHHADDTQAAAAIRLLLFTGARCSEIIGLRWEWIRGTRAVLPDSKTDPKTIQLPSPARAVLHGLPRTGCYVFPNVRGDGPMTDFCRRWYRLRNLVGLDGVRIHDLRHSYASHAVMNGLDLYTVGRLPGHADTGSTERYAYLADGHVRDAAGRIGGIVGDAMSGGRKEGTDRGAA